MRAIFMSKMTILRSFGGLSQNLLLLLLLTVALASTRSIASEENGDLPDETTIVGDENHELSDEALDSIIKDFGQKIGETMKDEVNKILDDVEESNTRKGRLDSAELEKFKEANEALSEDTQARIEMAGKKNHGEMTRSIIGDKAQSFLTQVSGRLQSAGTYIGHQMSSLANMAPKVQGKLRTIPGKLRKLMQWPNFLRYKIKFNKAYKSLREELYRQLIFLHTQTMVGVQNLRYLVGKASHLLKATQFADMTKKEFADTYNNPEAEQVDQDGRMTGEHLSPAAVQQLKQLALEHRNIFGQDMDKLADGNKHHHHHNEAEARRRRRRRRRSIQFIENSELDEDEEMEDAFDEVNSSHGGDEELGNELMDTDEFQVVDDYAAQFDSDADMSSMDEIGDLMDEALESEKVNFKGIDLRDTNCVPKPENQDKCGACYAYVVTAAATYYNCISQPEGQRKTERMNSRFLSDCGRYLARDGEKPFVNGCRGGKLTQAFNFTRQAGGYHFMRYEVARVSFNQYKSDTCAYPRPDSLAEWAPIQVPFFQNMRIVYLELDQVDLHLRTIGPVFVNLRTWENFAQYGSGVFGDEKESENPVIHSMWIVGHDKDQSGNDYWIIWNSHGTAWGEYGYLRIYSKALLFYKVYIGGLMSVNDILTKAKKN